MDKSVQRAYERTRRHSVDAFHFAKCGEKIVSGKNVPAEELKGIMEFLTVFVDKCHHGKEEDFLFPALEAAGIAKDGATQSVSCCKSTSVDSDILQI